MYASISCMYWTLRIYINKYCPPPKQKTEAGSVFFLFQTPNLSRAQLSSCCADGSRSMAHVHVDNGPVVIWTWFYFLPSNNVSVLLPHAATRLDYENCVRPRRTTCLSNQAVVVGKSSDEEPFAWPESLIEILNYTLSVDLRFKKNLSQPP